MPDGFRDSIPGKNSACANAAHMRARESRVKAVQLKNQWESRTDVAAAERSKDKEGGGEARKWEETEEEKSKEGIKDKRTKKGRWVQGGAENGNDGWEGEQVWRTGFYNTIFCYLSCKMWRSQPAAWLRCQQTTFSTFLPALSPKNLSDYLNRSARMTNQSITWDKVSMFHIRKKTSGVAVLFLGHAMEGDTVWGSAVDDAYTERLFWSCFQCPKFGRPV